MGLKVYVLINNQIYKLMKKLFTLITVALAATSVNAQDLWDAMSLTFDETTKVVQSSADGSVAYQVTTINNPNIFEVSSETKVYPEGTYAAGGVDVLPSDGKPLEMKSYELTIKTEHMTLHAVSTPNADASENEGWQLGGGGNNALNTEDCVVKFEKYIKPKNGNPSVSYKQYYEETTNGTSFRVNETLWTPESGVMPMKGLYYEFTPSVDGDLLLGIIVWRPGNKVYVFEKSSMTQFPTSALSIDGYVNNNTVVWGTNTTAFSTIQMTDNHDYQIEGIPGKQILGFMKLNNLEANKTYVLLSSNAQPGIYGFQFTAGTDGISDIAADKAAISEKTFNLAGQQVSNGFRGIVVKNGKKFIK